MCYAKVQGCSGCVEHFKNAKFPCHDRDCLPLVFAGVRLRPRRAPACRSLPAAVRAPAGQRGVCLAVRPRLST